MGAICFLIQVVDEDTERYQPQNQPLGYFTLKQLLGGHLAHHYYPSSLAAQATFSPSGWLFFTPIPSTASKWECCDRSCLNIKVVCVCCSPLNHITSHFIREGNQLVKHNSLLTNASLIIVLLLKYLEMESKRMCFSRDWCEAEQPNRLSRLLLLHYGLPHLPKRMEVYAHVNHITLMGQQLLNTSSSHFVNTANSLLHGK